jgi:threonine dehydratase
MTNMKFKFPTKEDLLEARIRIADMIHNTPVLTSRILNEMTGAELFFKCENFQRMGAFKMRGASNAILQLSEEQRNAGVVTHSSGNFAQAVSLSAQLVGCPALIVMPQNAPDVKKDAVRGYGGSIIESASTPQAREEMAKKTVAETNGSFIHPSDDIDVIVGNSTAAQELIEEIPDLDMIITPVGGGGLVAGTALAASHFSPGTSVIGAEPTGADDAYRSLRDGIIHSSIDPDTICDGLRTNLGQWNFPIIQKLLDRIVLVDDSATIAALKLIFERMKIVVEPSSAIVLAAVLSNPDYFKHKRIGLIISGGNINTAILGRLLDK